MMEELESRRLLSVDSHMRPAALDAVSTKATAPAVSFRASTSRALPAQAYTTFLTQDLVKTILAHAGSQAGPGQIICVVDRDGHILGLLETTGVPGRNQAIRNFIRNLRTIKAIDEAITAAFFQSTEDAFSTRTARFIIQDHFPQPLHDTPGGPLYGVEFSSQPGSDVFGKTAFAISGDPGGIPLYINGVPVGGIGVSGDGVDRPVRTDVFIKGDPDAKGAPFDGNEERDFDEAVALAGAEGFMAPDAIRADKIFVGGLRFPFIVDSPANAKPQRTFAQLTSGVTPGASMIPFTNPFSGVVMADGSLHDGSRQFPKVIFDGVSGELRDPVRYGAVASGAQLTKSDVRNIIDAAVRQALITRAAIREPIGVAARVHVCVVDAQGNKIGSFRMDDGTNFSHDVAVQKARTAVFFSSDAAAFSSRAIGFLAQRFFPPGIGQTGPGPLFQIQNDLSGLNPATLTPTTPKFAGVLRNGMTIFPGGFPLYKNGKLVGAVGVSGDGVDQDDLIAYAGTLGLCPPTALLSDHLNDRQIRDALLPKLDTLQAVNFVNRRVLNFARARLAAGLSHIRLPYVKFPRNPTL